MMKHLIIKFKGGGEDEIALPSYSEIANKVIGICTDYISGMPLSDYDATYDSEDTDERRQEAHQTLGVNSTSISDEQIFTIWDDMTGEHFYFDIKQDEGFIPAIGEMLRLNEDVKTYAFLTDEEEEVLANRVVAESELSIEDIAWCEDRECAAYFGLDGTAEAKFAMNLILRGADQEADFEHNGNRLSMVHDSFWPSEFFNAKATSVSDYAFRSALLKALSDKRSSTFRSVIEQLVEDDRFIEFVDDAKKMVLH